MRSGDCQVRVNRWVATHHSPRPDMDKTFTFLGDKLRSLPMPELRKDPIVGRWVIIATDRAKRPVAPKQEQLPTGSQVCPFCEGHETDTPLEILAYRDRNSGR